MSSSVFALASRAATLVIGVLPLLLVDGGCSEADCGATANCSALDAGIDALGGDGETPSGTLTLEATPPAPPFFLVQGSVTQVPVEITRQGSVGAVIVRAVKLPQDATSTPVTIAPGETKAMLGITPAATTPQGPVEIELEAVAEAADGTRASAKVAVFVRGAPGTLDTTFAGTGIVASALGSPEGNVYAIRETADGKLLLVARRINNTVVVARHEPSGPMDTSFGALGIVNLTSSQTGADLDIPLTGPGKDFLYALVKAPVSGGTLFRLGPDGNANGFPTDGISILGTNVRGLQFTALATGNAMLLRTHPVTPDAQLKLERWRPDGSVDTFYGCYVARNGTSLNSGRMVVREDGSALVFVQIGSELAFTVCDPSGAHDPSIGTSPEYMVSLGTRRLDRLAGAPDGGAVFATSDDNGHLTWSRVSAKGVIDTSVGTGGIASGFAYGNDMPVMIVQPDGKVVFAAQKVEETRQDIFNFMRFLPNGDPDPSFGTNGTVTLPLGEGKWLDVASITLDAYGRILVGMNAHDLGDSPILRFWP